MILTESDAPGAETTRLREIPYNYTSFSDREIVVRFLGQEMWNVLNQLRVTRRTGRSARMIFEILGDLWIVTRNPLIQDDLLASQKRRDALLEAMNQRLDQVRVRAEADNRLVFQMLDHVRKAISDFEDWLSREEALRRKAYQKFLEVTQHDRIDFSGIARVSHATDATDWRVAYPFVVLTPDTEKEVLALVRACIDLNLTVIPRGGGTGYTGSAVPLYPDTAVINTEKLNTVEPVAHNNTLSTIRAGAGAITQHVAETAEAEGLVFAVDPTSRGASTIGGNVAMNAGGKKAVRWGTTIDNLASWRMVTPDATWLEVTRLHRNQDHTPDKFLKTHDLSEVHFRVDRFEADGVTARGKAEVIRLTPEEIRKTGLGKDVTNKHLGGLPGVQKEGCDGLVTSAEFILHRMPEKVRTICLEFFGSDLSRAVSAIVAIKSYMDSFESDAAALVGLEHLDARYVQAIAYATKSSRGERPRMVLLADIAGDDEAIVSSAAHRVVALASERGGEGFIAEKPEARTRFWEDRSRTAAIAAHTNAFKINEDVVIPVDKLAEYTAEIERINIEQSVQNKLQIVETVRAFLEGTPCEEISLPPVYKRIMEDKKRAARLLLENVQKRWKDFLSLLSLASLTSLASHKISYRMEVERPLKEIFSGSEMVSVRRKLDEIHASIRSGRLFVALHMHAGDGNVHTNIPVNSNDYAMLHEAEGIVERVMALAVRLGGVISGEHGIGLTKFRFLDADKKSAFARYKAQVDPRGSFNRGKLLPESLQMEAYTPSFRLVEQEALILKESALGLLSDHIRRCLRCGKCKPVCSTHVPKANLLYSPRNKILVTGLILEAFLYEEQTRRGLSKRHFDSLNDLADHCTVCHRCESACPVDIDFGETSVHMREILKSRGKRRRHPGSIVSLAFLSASDATTVRMMRMPLIQWGFAAQRLGCAAVRMFQSDFRPVVTTERASRKDQMLSFFEKPLPDKLPKTTARAQLALEDSEVIPLLRDPSLKESSNTETVFYFPGCGSERLFSDIALASLALLYHAGVQTVLPPGYICCGFPQASSGDRARGRQIAIANRVLFHRVANTLNYLDIKTVLVSCGTCFDQLAHYHFEEIFPGCRLMDIHEYLMEKGIHTSEETTRHILHDPCHTPMKTYDPKQVVSTLLGGETKISDRCCAEAGMFATARPDIATQVRFSKESVLKHDLRKDASTSTPTLLTTCPACLQGLSRYREETGVKPRFLAEILAERLLGSQWQENFVQSVTEGGIERIL